MNPERWAEVERLYHGAAARPASEREAFLRAACAGDETLQRDVESLLAQQSAGAGGLLDGPAWAGVASLLDEPSVSLLAPGSQLGPYRIHSLWAQAGWARSTGRSMSGCAATSRSR